MCVGVGGICVYGSEMSLWKLVSYACVCGMLVRRNACVSVCLCVVRMRAFEWVSMCESVYNCVCIRM